MKRKVASGREELVGMTGKVVQDLNPEGTVFAAENIEGQKQRRQPYRQGRMGSG